MKDGRDIINEIVRFKKEYQKNYCLRDNVSFQIKQIQWSYKMDKGEKGTVHLESLCVGYCLKVPIYEVEIVTNSMRFTVDDISL